MDDNTLEFDIVIVGAGPAGLSAAIKLAQLSQQHSLNLSICVLDKGRSVGAHILSGAVLEPRALNELIPDWRKKKAPLNTPVTEDEFLFFTKKTAWRLPTPPQMQNHGNYIISLGLFCQWLATQAENLGVNIFPEFAASTLIYDHNQVCGVITGEKGLDKEGNKTHRYQPGMKLFAKQTFIAEGCRGSLSQELFKKFNLRQDCNPQTYGLGIKELWEIPESLHQSGKVTHTIGWPLDNHTYGGSFLYHFEKNLLAIGLVIGLDYANPYLNPYEEFQLFKTHPHIAPLLTNSKRLAYGARCINEGGLQSIPKLSFPGGVFIGCSAGFVNVPKIKGIHTAMQSGIIAAESYFETISAPSRELKNYAANIKNSWITHELKKVRNIRPAFRWGLWVGLINAALETYILKGKAPWTLTNNEDYAQTKPATDYKIINYPKHDGKITFDLMSSVFLTQAIHPEDQPCHLKLKNLTTPLVINQAIFASPETRYCPAGVYEIEKSENNAYRFIINAANCIHCKACDIKDPTQNIVWTPPEGGSGPQYNNL